MKINRESLLNELKFVTRAAARSPSEPILSHALWRQDGGRLHLAATDIETYLRSSVECEGELGGELAVPAAAAVTLLSEMFDEEVEITLDGQGWLARDSRTRADLQGLTADDWPEPPAVDSESEEYLAFEVSGSELLGALAAVRHAAEPRTSTSSAARSLLPGLLITPPGDDEPLTVATANDHRVAVSGVVGRATPKAPAIRIRAEDLQALETMAPSGVEASAAWALATDAHRAQFRTPAGRSAQFRRPAGGFPEVGELMKGMAALPHRFTVERLEFIRAARAAAACPGAHEHAVALEILEGDGGLAFVGRGPWSSVRVECPATVAGPAMKIGFTGAYLIELAESLEAKEIEIQYESASKPIFYQRPPTEDRNRGEWRVVAQRTL